MTNQHILELVEQKRISPETALELLNAQNKTSAIVKLVAEHRLNAVAAAFILETDRPTAGKLLLATPERATRTPRRQKNNRGRTPRLTLEQHHRIIELYKAGLSTVEVGRKIGVHYETIRDHLTYAGLIPCHESKAAKVDRWREIHNLYLDLTAKGR
jgi:DNA-binding CsgD family transcriptional regulator